jgi:V/A-type H+-transporting ATPase subunit I
MIVPMKKVTILGLNRLREESLVKLRELGLLHIERKAVQSDVLTGLLEKKASLESASAVLRTFAPKKADLSDGSSDGASATGASEPPADLRARVHELAAERKDRQDRIYADTREISRIEKWGDFDPAALKELAEKGITLIPYELSKKAFGKLGDNRVIVLGRDKTSVYCLAVDTPIPGEGAFRLPERSLSKLRESVETQGKIVSSIEKELAALSSQKGRLEAEQDSLSRDIEFETAKVGMGVVEDCPPAATISYITGFIPAPELGALKRAASENGWAFCAADPAAEDAPPTLIKSGPAVRIIQPLFSFLGTVPGYREYDISPSYLLFFSIFFAMIFGDAAYGLLLFIGTALIGAGIKKKTGKMPDAVKLFCWLAFCTVVWGAVNGAWFAIPYENLPAILQALVLPQFNPNVPLAAFPGILQSVFKMPAEQPGNTAYWNMQFLCFSIAIIQLVYAHLKNFKKQLPSLSAIAQLGWLVMMVGLYFLILSMLLKMAMPVFAPYFIGGGLAVYFIFVEQKGGNPLANVGRSFSNFLPTFLNAVSSFADIISYIRLFAVGLAGTSIAQSFNLMSGIGGIAGAGATDTGVSVMDIVLKLLAAAFILVFGHGLNMVMNALSVIVHGVRLNLLEYAGNHLAIEWSGYSYKPFAVGQGKNT